MRFASQLMAGVATIASLGGCSTLDVWSYKPSKLSGTPPGETVLILLPSKAEVETKATTLLQADGQVSRFIADCAAKPGEATPPIAAAVIPLVASAVQLGFEAYIDKKRRDVEGIVEASQAVYSINAVLQPADLTGAQCIVLVRYTEDDKKVLTEQMTAVLRVTSHGFVDQATTRIISFKPVFVRAKTAVATTRESEKPAVGFSFAASVKAVFREPNQAISRLAPTGEAVATAKEVPLGKAAVITCTQGECGSSDLPAEAS